MKIVYPVIISKDKKFLIATIPDCNIDTQGENLVEAIEMARDAISISCVGEQDAGRQLPMPSDIAAIKHSDENIITLVDVDIDSYRRKLENRTVRKNLTIPSWINEQAEQAGINFWAILLKALKQELNLLK